MKTFNLWLEEILQRNQQEQIQKIYDLTVKQLLGAAKDQYHISLNDIEADASAGSPPQQNGAIVVLDKLNRGQIFNRIQSLGDTKLARQAQDTQSWLTQVANKQNVGSQGTVGELLNRLFGDNALDIYGKRQWELGASKKAPHPPPMGNVTNNQPPSPVDNMGQMASIPGQQSQIPNFTS